MSTRRPQDPMTKRIRDEEDQIKTLGPVASGGLAHDPTLAGDEVDATVLPDELPQPAMKGRTGPLGGPSGPEGGRVGSPTETVLRPRTELKRRSSWAVWVFAFLVLAGIGFGVAWFIINPSGGGGEAGAAAGSDAQGEPVVATSADAAAAADAELEVAAADALVEVEPEVTAVAGGADGAGEVAEAAEAGAQGDAVLEAAADGLAPGDAAADGAVALGDGAGDGGVALAGADPDAAPGDAGGGAAGGDAAAPEAAVVSDAQAAAGGGGAPPEAKPPEKVVVRDPAEANRLNEAGLVARKAGDHGRAMSLYAAALEKNPDNVWARYNYACELSLAGRTKEALAELTALYKLGTPESRRALVAARKDADFDAIRGTGQFFRLTNF